MEGNLPEWVQIGGAIGIAIVSVITGVYKYIKTQATKGLEDAKETTAIVATSMVDSRLIKELIDALRENSEELSREMRKALRSNQDVREAIQENTEAVTLQSDATINLLRFIKLRKGVEE